MGILRGQILHKFYGLGPYYLWTCKVAGKTQCHALSRDQYEVLKRFIAANRKLERTLARMRALSLETVLKTLPGVKVRK